MKISTGKLWTLAAALLVAAPLLLAAPPARTLRVDYVHQGTANTESFGLDRVVLEPLPWPGNPAKPVDDSNLGKFKFEVRDAKTKNLLYSRGFASIFGEWQDTAKALNSTGKLDATHQVDCEESFIFASVVQKRFLYILR